MKVGLTYDLRDDYLAQGFDEETAAEFDRPETIQAIADVLASRGYEPVLIGNLEALMRRLLAGERWAFVFNIAEGLHGLGRESQVPALLDAYQIPYTFSDPMVLALTLHKGMAKHVVRDCKIPTADFAVVNSLADISTINLPYPLFAKPVAEGTGKGVTAASKVRTREQLHNVCAALLEKFAQPVLVETYLPGREFTVGVVGTGAAARSLGVMEVLLRDEAEPGAYSFHNKEFYEGLVDYRLEQGSLAEQVNNVALAAWRALGCRDGGRLDIRLDADGVPNFIEVNPLAGLNPIRSDLAILARFINLPYDELIAAIVSSTEQRIALPRPVSARIARAV
jgi:D-alanine-D-alanine ligase